MTQDVSITPPALPEQRRVNPLLATPQFGYYWGRLDQPHYKQAIKLTGGRCAALYNALHDKLKQRLLLLYGLAHRSPEQRLARYIAMSRDPMQPWAEYFLKFPAKATAAYADYEDLLARAADGDFDE